MRTQLPILEKKKSVFFFALHFRNLSLSKDLDQFRGWWISLVLADEANCIQFQGQLAWVYSKDAVNILILCEHFEPCGLLVTNGDNHSLYRFMSQGKMCVSWTPRAAASPPHPKKAAHLFWWMLLRTSRKVFCWRSNGNGGTANIDTGLTPGWFLRSLLTLSDRLLQICLLWNLSTYSFYLSWRFVHPRGTPLHNSVPF